MIQWHIGCSGFYYNHWKNIFYPEGMPKTKWFKFYTGHYDTLELNVTFYRFPQLSFLQSWYERSHDNFSFAVKAPRLITHYKQFNDVTSLMEDFYGVIREGLKEKLGCVLFQLPPRAAYTEERLQKIIESLDKSFDNVLEFRHNTWWNAEVYDKLAKHKITFCGMSHPHLPKELIINKSVLYYRFHGVPQLYKSKYKRSTLQRIADEIEESGKVKKAYLYFNNDIDGSAIENARQMQEIVARQHAH